MSENSIYDKIFTSKPSKAFILSPVHSTITTRWQKNSGMHRASLKNDFKFGINIPFMTKLSRLNLVKRFYGAQYILLLRQDNKRTVACTEFRLRMTLSWELPYHLWPNSLWHWCVFRIGAIRGRCCLFRVLVRCKRILHKMLQTPAVQNNEKNVFILFALLFVNHSVALERSSTHVACALRTATNFFTDDQNYHKIISW